MGSTDEVIRPLVKKVELVLPNIPIDWEQTGKVENANVSVSDRKGLALLDKMIAQEKQVGLKQDASTSCRDYYLLKNMLAETGSHTKEQDKKAAAEILKVFSTSPDDYRKDVQASLKTQLKEKYKDTWSLLPREYQEALVKLQEAVTGPDLKQLAELAKSLKPEVAEKMGQLIEKNLREQGAKVHIKSVDGQFLWYQDNAKVAVLIGKDGKASVVAIEANEPEGPPNILEGKKPFKSVQTLAKEIADSAVQDLRLKEKTGRGRQPNSVELPLTEKEIEKHVWKITQQLYSPKKYINQGKRW